jgi:hypothetical protein
MAARACGSRQRRSGPLSRCTWLLLLAGAALAWSAAAAEGGQRSPRIYVYDLPANMSSMCSFNNQP